jgi:hypothetical protein
MSDRTCRPDTPLACASRKAAMESEDFRYLDGLGWVWWRAINPVRPWVRCPWCDGALPMPGAVLPDEKLRGLMGRWPESPYRDEGPE